MRNVFISAGKNDMAERSKDWLWQAERDLNHARNSQTTRYPNGFASGAPGQFYDKKDSDKAIEYASIIIEFSKNQID
jgi:hypothetical protein